MLSYEFQENLLDNDIINDDTENLPTNVSAMIIYDVSFFHDVSISCKVVYKSILFCFRYLLMYLLYKIYRFQNKYIARTLMQY